MDEQFLKYLQNAKDEFITQFINTRQSTADRVLAENFIIAFDQLLDQAKNGKTI